MSYTVIVCDMFHYADPEHEIEVPGFPTGEAAIEYARRRVRSSLEALRKPGQTPEELRHLWYTFGEDCRVVGPEGVVYRASEELERFIRHPATPEACDYIALYESLLPGDFALRCEWAAGTVPPPYHYEYHIVLRPYEPPPDAGEALYPRMQGEITFWPDYPGADVPAWQETFSVGTHACLRVYALLEDGGLLRPEIPQQETDAAIGGETATLEVTANGRTGCIRSTDLPPEQRAFLLETVMPAVRQTVPGPVWERLEARRQAYHQGREPRIL
ncbi:MAG: hypothetical protein D6791_17135 [Chloroflexi bacterium]|nr:MAG: hypothetical protein D6791_17135 [Chloroflexota bacterium]